MADSDLQIKGGGGGGGEGVLGASVWSKDKGEGVGEGGLPGSAAAFSRTRLILIAVCL